MSAIDLRYRLARPGFQLDIAATLPGRGVTALFGRSGSGKTTLLRCVAGLERPAEGYFAIDGECWQDSARALCLAPHRRAIGYVFQDAGLLPHLTVRANLGYGLRRTAAADRRLGLDAAVDWAGIGHLLARAPAQLSGGERSRVAIARALLTAPRLLLMDEPLAALDVGARAELLPYLERLHRELAIPVLYVSHALDEVARLADHVLVLEGGRLQAQGPLAGILAGTDSPLARLDEAGAVVEATVLGHDADYHLAELAFDGGRLWVADAGLTPGQPVRVRILARDVSISRDLAVQTSILNILPARVVEIVADRPAQALVRLETGGAALLARITRKSVAALALAPGQEVYAQVKSVALLR